jgi:hypothetical protein
MALDVSAPKSGYATDAKKKYRQEVWSCLLPAWHLWKHDERAHVLILPSREGLEIDHLISLGVPENRIVAIDKSAAVIATSHWRKKFPSVKFFTTSVGDAWVKIKKSEIVICAANLDFCSNFCHALIQEYAYFVRKCPKFEGARIAATVAKGREGKALVAMLKKFAPHLSEYNEPRCAALLSCSNLDHEHMLWGQGDYISGKNPMSWFVMSDSWIRNSFVRAHIEYIKSLDVNDCAAAVRAKFPSWQSRKAVEHWFDDEIAKPFMDSMECELDRYGGVLVNRSSIGCPYSPLAQQSDYIIGKIWQVM